MRRSQWVTLATIIVVLIVAGFCWKRDRDNKDSGRLGELERQHTVDSLARVKAEARTDSVIRVVEVVKASAMRVDTLWRSRSNTIIKTIHDIVADTSVADSTKVLQIALKADSLKQWGDLLATENRALILAVNGLEFSVKEEREAAARERAGLMEQNKLLKRQSRHWGLGAAAGYGLARLPDGTVKAAPQLTAGIVYRW